MSSNYLDPNKSHPPSPVPSSTLGVSPQVPPQPTFPLTTAPQPPRNNPFTSASPASSSSDQLTPPMVHSVKPLPPIVIASHPLAPADPSQQPDDGRYDRRAQDRTSSGSNLLSARHSTASTTSNLWTGHSTDGAFRLSAIGREFPLPPTGGAGPSPAGLGFDQSVYPAEAETEEEQEERKRMETLKELGRKRAAAAQRADRPSYFEMYSPEGGSSTPLKSRTHTPTTPTYQTPGMAGPSPSQASFVSTSTAYRIRNPFTNRTSSAMPSPSPSNRHTPSGSPPSTPVQSGNRRSQVGVASESTDSHSRSGSIASSKARSEGRAKRLSSLYSSSNLPQAPYPSGPLPPPPLPTISSPSLPFPAEPDPTPPSQTIGLPDTSTDGTFRSISESSTGAGAFQSSGGSVNSHVSAVIVTAKRASTATALASPGLTLQRVGPASPGSAGPGGQERLLDMFGDERSQHRMSALSALEGRGTPSPGSPARSGPSTPVLPHTPPFRSFGTTFPLASSPGRSLNQAQQDTIARLLTPTTGASPHTPDLAFLAGPSDYPFPHISSSPPQPPKPVKRHSDAPSSSSRRSTRFAAALLGGRSNSHRSSGGTTTQSHPYKSSRPSSSQSNISTPVGVKRTTSRIKRWEAGLSLAKLVSRADRVVQILDHGGAVEGSSSGGTGYVHAPGLSSSRRGKLGKRQASLRSWVSGGGGGGTSSRRSTGRAGGPTPTDSGAAAAGGASDFVELSDSDEFGRNGKDKVVMIAPLQKNTPPAVPEKTAMRRRSLGKRLSALGGRWAGGQAVDEEGAERGLIQRGEKEDDEGSVVVIGFEEQLTRAALGPSSAYERKPLPAPPPGRSFWTRRRKIILAAAAVLVLLVLLISLPVALLAGKDHNHSPAVGGGGGDTPTRCPSGLVGSFCNLNSTCVCTSSSSCSPLAASLVTLTASASSVFNTTISPSSLASILSASQGPPPTDDPTNCSTQALLVDVGPNLSPSTQPRRLAFVQAALLWQLAKTEDPLTVVALRTFASKLSLAGVPDGPIALEDANQAAAFQTLSAGWSFDFARLEVTAPVVSWEGDAKPNEFQRSLVGKTTEAALGRIATLASVASTQSSLALSTYWSTTLSLPLFTLPTFLALLRSAPIILPFSAPSLISLTQSPATSASFPPPQACNPALSRSQRTALETFESSVFGLPPLSGPAAFDSPLCVAEERIVYGRLNLLHLRTAFIDVDGGLPSQGVVLNEDVKTRATLSVSSGGENGGPIFSALPATAGGGGEADLDPRNHGTFTHLDHVALAFLRAIPSVALAKSVVAFLLTPPSSPTNTATLLPLPPSLLTTPDLFPSLPSLPSIEIALLGSLPFQTINYTLSSLTYSPPTSLSTSLSTLPNSTLFFGSPASSTFRLWATQQQPPLGPLSPSVVWSEGPTAQRVVVMQGSGEEGFEAVFNKAARTVSLGKGDVGVVVKGLEGEGLFTA